MESGSKKAIAVNNGVLVMQSRWSGATYLLYTMTLLERAIQRTMMTAGESSSFRS